LKAETKGSLQKLGIILLPNTTKKRKTKKKKKGNAKGEKKGP
jgi:hypothetical protein